MAMTTTLHAAGGPRALQPVIEPWGSMLWLMENRLVAGAGASVARMTVHGGVTSPLHRHLDCSETIVLLEGRATCRIGGREHALAPGDAAFVPPGTAHAVRNDGDTPAVLLIAYSAGTRVYEAVEA
jgi:mannose-6-phosphate isomerase-like protein (cupin superfamily)